MEYKDYYAIMGLKRDAPADEVKRAYRKLARRYHPDVSKASDAEERFKEVNEAYEVLKDPEKRRAYDRLGERWQAGQEFHPPPDWPGEFAFGGGGFTARDAGGFSDFFESLFGGGFGPLHAARARGGDQFARLVISLEEAYAGAVKTLTLQRPESAAAGRTVLRPHALKVTLPRGVREGQQIRLSGQGMPGGAGVPPGDLYLEIAFAPHRRFRAEGRDIHLALPVAPWEAALGARVAVPTLGGKVELSVPAGARAGQTLRLKGRGLPGTPPGDQYVLLQIVTPPARTERQRALYERMREEMNFDPRAEAGLQ